MSPNVPYLSVRKRTWRSPASSFALHPLFCTALPAIRVVVAIDGLQAAKGPHDSHDWRALLKTRKNSTHQLSSRAPCSVLPLTTKAATMDESLPAKVDGRESLTGKPPFKPLGLPHRITSSNSATNLHGTDELDDSDRDGRVLALLTGGTMGMKPNARGSLEPEGGYLAEQMRLMPELERKRMPAYEVVEYAPLLDSADMVPQDWRRIAQDIAQSHNQFDGFVVIMGTDTMAYCASALSFMLEGLSNPSC